MERYVISFVMRRSKRQGKQKANEQKHRWFARILVVEVRPMHREDVLINTILINDLRFFSSRRTVFESFDSDRGGGHKKSTAQTFFCFAKN